MERLGNRELLFYQPPVTLNLGGLDLGAFVWYSPPRTLTGWDRITVRAYFLLLLPDVAVGGIH